MYLVRNTDISPPPFRPRHFTIVVAIFFILVASHQNIYTMYFLWLYFLSWWPASRIYIPCIFCGYIFYSGGYPPGYVYNVFFGDIFFLLVASHQDMYMMYFLWL